VADEPKYGGRVTWEVGPLSSIPDDIWRQIFSATGNSPRHWFVSAGELWSGAGVLEAHYTVLQPPGDLMLRGRAIEVMLKGMALEAALKGLWLKATEHLPPDERNRVLDRNGELQVGSGFKRHDLVALARLADLTLTKPEAELLERTSSFVKHAGRYPIPLKLDQFMPAVVDGLPLSRTFFRPEDFVALKALWDRVVTQAGDSIAFATCT
jgi:hypothetical protein